MQIYNSALLMVRQMYNYVDFHFSVSMTLLKPSSTTATCICQRYPEQNIWYEHSAQDIKVLGHSWHWKIHIKLSIMPNILLIARKEKKWDFNAPVGSKYGTSSRSSSANCIFKVSLHRGKTVIWFIYIMILSCSTSRKWRQSLPYQLPM